VSKAQLSRVIEEVFSLDESVGSGDETAILWAGGRSVEWLVFQGEFSAIFLFAYVERREC